MSEVFEGAIGIDLGTTYSCVAVFLHDHVEVIANDQGNRTTPSCVAFSGDEVLVGDSAKNLAARGMPGVIYDAKRLIGHHFSDKGVQEDKVHWPFSVVPGKQDKVEIQVDFRGETLRLAPEEISARVLAYLKGCAEKYLGKQVKKAVVTVPAYFNDAQRERTKAAATIAGLDVLRIINEPTAAALCYGLGVQDAAQGSSDAAPLQVLVFDLGGGTFDVSIITVDGGTFAVRATAGDTHLGGQDIDNNLLQYVVTDCQTRHGVDLNAQPRHLARARAACERVKRVLSHTTAEELVLDGVLPGGEDFVLTLSRAKLEELNAAVFERCMSVVKAALRDAKANAQEMDAVILVGGSSRIPKVQALLGELFPGRRLSNAVHPDEAVAVGAAVQASILSTAPAQQSAKTASMVLMDVVPLSIGVEIDNGKFDVVIPRNTTIPYRATKEYSTVEDNQQDVDIAVFEGERTQTRHNHKLGEFSLEGITRAKKGEPTIVVTFSVDADGLLTITASEDLAKKTKTLVVQSSDRLSEAEVQKMLAQAERLARSKDMSKRGTNAADAAPPPTSGGSAKGMSVAEATRVMNDALAELEAAVAAATGTASTDTLQACNKLLSHGREWMRRKLASYTEGPELGKKVRKVLKRVGRAIKLTQRTDQPPAAGLAPAPSNNVRSPLHGTKRARSASAESEDSESEPEDAASLPAPA